MIKLEDVRHIAKLARLGISKQEEENFQHDLSSILEYVKLLETVDVSKVDLIDSSSEEYFKKSVVRDDIFENKEVADKIIEAFPNKEGRYNKVKSVFK